MQQTHPTTASEVLQDELAWWDQTMGDERGWTFARTMPETPHDYLVRGKHLNDVDFERAVRLIRRLGEPGKFNGRLLVYFQRDGKRYWTMGAPLDKTTIINRADQSEVYGEQDAPSTATPYKSVYDLLATDYDVRYSTPECRDENRAVKEAIKRSAGRVPDTALDVGAGTGLFLDMRLVPIRNVVCVEPSQAMLNELLRKHPAAHVVANRYHPALDLPYRSFDLIVALFGSASYLTPHDLDSLVERLSPNGTAYVMAYKAGYWPDYEEEPETAAPIRDHLRDDQRWQTMAWHNFVVGTVQNIDGKAYQP